MYVAQRPTKHQRVPPDTDAATAAAIQALMEADAREVNGLDFRQGQAWGWEDEPARAPRPKTTRRRGRRGGRLRLVRQRPRGHAGGQAPGQPLGRASRPRRASSAPARLVVVVVSRRRPACPLSRQRMRLSQMRLLEQSQHSYSLSDGGYSFERHHFLVRDGRSSAWNHIMTICRRSRVRCSYHIIYRT